MKPVRLDVQPFSLGFVRPFETAAGTLTGRQGLTVRVTDSLGRVGYGEVAPLPGFSDESLTDAACEFEGIDGVPWPKAFGELSDLDSISAACSAMVKLPSARHGLELALCDLLAQSRNIPLANLFNPRARLVGYSSRVARSGTDALDAVKDGVRTVKIKVGMFSLAEDLGRVSEVRRAVGDKPAIRLDANGAWAVDDAINILEKLSEFDIECIEQPVAAKNLDALAEVRRASKIRVAADESVRSAADLEEVLAQGAADIVVLKPMLCGGPIEAWKMAQRAAAEGLEVIVTTSLDAAVGRLGAMHLAAAIPGDSQLCAGVDTGRWLETDTFSVTTIEHGCFSLSEGPGLALSVGETNV